MNSLKLIAINLMIVFPTLTLGHTSLPYNYYNFIEQQHRRTLARRDEIIPFDVYSNDGSKAIPKDRLDNFADEAKRRPNETGYIISYSGRRAKTNESLNNLNKIKHYLTKKKKIPLQRLKFIDGGYREKRMIYFYFVPEGVRPPQPAPTVLASEVEIIK